MDINRIRVVAPTVIEGEQWARVAGFYNRPLVCLRDEDLAGYNGWLFVVNAERLSDNQRALIHRWEVAVPVDRCIISVRW